MRLILSFFYSLKFYHCYASQVALGVENQPANAEDVRDTGSIQGQEDPLKEGMATHSSILAWRIP